MTHSSETDSATSPESPGLGDSLATGISFLLVLTVLQRGVGFLRSVGKGSVVFADGMLYCLGERHEVALVEAKPDAYSEKGRFKIDSLGRPSWAHPVVCNGKFYIRNQGEITCYDVGGQ